MIKFCRHFKKGRCYYGERCNFSHQFPAINPVSAASDATDTEAGLVTNAAPELLGAIRKQIEHYFSFDNLLKDTFLREHMDLCGWLPFSLIAGFKAIRKLASDVSLLSAAVCNSPTLEVNPATTHLRLKNDWKQWILTRTVCGSQLRASAPEFLPTEVSSASVPNEPKPDLIDKPISLMGALPEASAGAPSRVVVLHGVFSPSHADLASDPEFYNNIHADVEMECQTYGPIQKVWVDQTSCQGDVWIRFSDVPSATDCQRALDKRYYAGQRISAEFAHNPPEHLYEASVPAASSSEAAYSQEFEAFWRNVVDGS